MPSRLTRFDRLIIILCSSIIFAIAFNAINADTFSDPKLNFVVSQAILEYGTIYLDAYENELILGRPFDYFRDQLDILSYNGHYYHYHPVGASILALPFVWVAMQAGMDMLTADNFWLQNFLSACSLVLLFWLLLAIGQILTRSKAAALTISFVSILGSGLMSTLGVAFWTLNYSTLLYCLTIWLLLCPQYAVQTTTSALPHRWRIIGLHLLPYAIGVTLFAAFYARASAVAFILPVFAYLLWRDWRFAQKTMVTSALLFGLFLLSSQLLFGSWLPDYYEVERITIKRLPVYMGLIGNLFSPSRGLFIFSPMYGITLLGLILFSRRLYRNGLLWLCLAWFGLTLLLGARAATWYGGWSFGPRLITDAAVSWVILTFILWSAARPTLNTTARTTILALYLSLGGFAIYINSYQGLYNQATAQWNAYINPLPNIHAAHPWGDMFNWAYPQWRADGPMLCQLEQRTAQHLIDSPLPIGRLENAQPIGFADAEVITHQDILFNNELPIQPVFVGWSAAGSTFRWSHCPEARIYFDFGRYVAGSDLYTFTVRVLGLKTQRVEIYLNGHLISEEIWDNQIAQRGEFYATAHVSQLHESGRNVLSFRFPEVEPASTADQRLLGFAFAGLKLEGLPP